MKALEILMGSVLYINPNKKRKSKWEKAFNSGFKNGYEESTALPPPCYRRPKITSLAWENGFLWGQAKRIKEENKGYDGELNIRLRA